MTTCWFLLACVFVWHLGQSRATWELSILDDGLLEPNKKLRLTLMDPVNTILGDNKKLRVVVVNAENGKLNIVLI